MKLITSGLLALAVLLFSVDRSLAGTIDRCDGEALLNTTILFDLKDSKDDASKMEQLQRIAKAFNLDKLIRDKFVQGIDEQMASEESELSAEVQASLRKKLIDNFDVNDFLQKALLPVVSKHFTLSQVTGLADFAESGMGQKIFALASTGKEFDIEGMIARGEISESELMDLKKLVVSVGPGLQALNDGTFGQEFEEAAKAYGESYVNNLFMDILSK